MTSPRSVHTSPQTADPLSPLSHRPERACAVRCGVLVRCFSGAVKEPVRWAAAWPYTLRRDWTRALLVLQCELGKGRSAEAAWAVTPHRRSVHAEPRRCCPPLPSRFLDSLSNHIDVVLPFRAIDTVTHHTQQQYLQLRDSGEAPRSSSGPCMTLRDVFVLCTPHRGAPPHVRRTRRGVLRLELKSARARGSQGAPLCSPTDHTSPTPGGSARAEH